jgi:hypothetical protein
MLIEAVTFAQAATRCFRGKKVFDNYKVITCCLGHRVDSPFGRICNSFAVPAIYYTNELRIK